MSGPDDLAGGDTVDRMEMHVLRKRNQQLDADYMQLLHLYNEQKSLTERAKADAARYRDAIERHEAQQSQYPLTTTHWDRELYDALDAEGAGS